MPSRIRARIFALAERRFAKLLLMPSCFTKLLEAIFFILPKLYKCQIKIANSYGCSNISIFQRRRIGLRRANWTLCFTINSPHLWPWAVSLWTTGKKTCPILRILVINPACICKYLYCTILGQIKMEIACTLRHPRKKIIDQLVPKWTKTGGPGPPSGTEV